MLRFMRENTGSWVIKIILGLIVIVFIFLGMGSFGSSKVNSVAAINDIPITIDEYNRSYQNTLEQIRERFGNNLNDELIKMFQVKKQAMDRLIEEYLITFEADKLDITISDKELQDSLFAIDAFKKDGKFDLSIYRRVLTANRLVPDTFENMQRETLRRAKVIDLILSSVKVSELEAKEWYIQNNSEMAVDYVKFTPDSYKVSPDKNALKDYYEKNKDKYKSEPQLKVKYIEFKSDSYKDKAAVSEESIKSYYEAHADDEFSTPEQVEVSHILIKTDENADADSVEKAKKEADDIYKKALAGEDFTELAKTYSQDPSAESNNGYLGKFSRNKMVKPFEEKAFSMKPDEISGPVKTQFGWHIIKLISKIEASKKTFEEAAPDIKNKLLTDESKNSAYNAASDFFDAVLDGDSLEQAALIAKQKVMEAGPFTMKGPENKDGSFKNAREFANAAFSISLNEISDVTEIGNSYYIIKPIEKKEPEILTFEQAEDKILTAVKSQMQDEDAKKAAEKFLASVKDVDKFADIAKEQGFTVQFTQLFKKDGNIGELGREPEIANAAFKLSEKNKLVSEVIKSSNGLYYIISFKEKKIPGEDVIKDNLESVKKELLRTKQGTAYTSWIEQIKKSSRIDIKQEFLDS